MSIQVFDLKRISIHAPHTRGDDFAQLFYVIGSQFQSTPLIRGATCLCSASSLVLLHISIHAPHTRGDLHWHRRITAFDIIQSTPLIRGATGPSWLTSHWESDFNPRPSYEGRLPCSRRHRNDRWNFNPRPSYEGRPSAANTSSTMKEFQSTPLIRGATSIPVPSRQLPSNFNPRPSYEGRP